MGQPIVRGRRMAAFALVLAGWGLWGAVACAPTAGSFDGGLPNPDGPGPTVNAITAADIGTPCEYDPGIPANPTNSCRQGMTCLIYTSDGAYIPFARGAAQNFTLGVWEDQFTRYRQDGVDEGVCTLVGSWSLPPACPLGTQLKLLATDLAVCVRTCQTAADCGRPGYVCDSRYLDLGGGQCVRACSYDLPDCIRSGHVSFLEAGEGGQVVQSELRFVLAADDLAGASLCEIQTGTCQPNVGFGRSGPGEPCVSSVDCAGGTVCIQADVLRSLRPDLPSTTQGFCAQPCKPYPQQQFTGGGCSAGYLCQPGFTFGHGDPLSEDPGQAFALVNLQTGEPLEAGGFCYPGCQADPDCSNYPGTRCGAASPAMFSAAWNGSSMCLPPSVLQ